MKIRDRINIPAIIIVAVKIIKFSILYKMKKSSIPIMATLTAATQKTMTDPIITAITNAFNIYLTDEYQLKIYPAGFGSFFDKLIYQFKIPRFKGNKKTTVAIKEIKKKIIVPVLKKSVFSLIFKIAA